MTFPRACSNPECACEQPDGGCSRWCQTLDRPAGEWCRCGHDACVGPPARVERRQVLTSQEAEQWVRAGLRLVYRGAATWPRVARTG
jgi:hypothetical protein